MGFLSDIRDGRRGWPEGGYIIVVGAVAGLVFGVAVARIVGFDGEDGAPLLSVIVSAGGILGLCLGMYAAFGTSLPARVLAIASVIVAAVASVLWPWLW